MKAFLEELWAQLGHVLKDLVVLGAWLIAIWLIGKLNATLYPPHGLVAFEGTDFEFKLEHLLHAGEIGAISVFLIRSIIGVALGAKK